MESLRWLRLVPLVAVIAAGALGPGRAVSGAGAGPAWDPPPCTEADAGGPPGTGAWYRLDPVLDRAGTLAAQRLTAGIAGRPSRHLDLAPESFASGPVGGLVLAGEDDGSVSRLRLLDPAHGCATAVADEPAVIRSAVLDPDGRSIVEHRVDRATRADLGIWRRTIGGSAVRMLDGLGPDPELGPTFATDLVVAADGRLVVSSCAMDAVPCPGARSRDRDDRPRSRHRPGARRDGRQPGGPCGLSGASLPGRCHRPRHRPADHAGRGCRHGRSRRSGRGEPHLRSCR